jgi:signal transduction histidine kinase
MRLSKWSQFFNPNSLVNRTLLLTLFAVFVAQAMAMSIWYGESKRQEIEGVRSVSSSMAGMFASTVTFFQSLPVKYRHIILDQVRNMGGTRFFVSLNKELLMVDPIEDSDLKQASLEMVRQVLREKLNHVQSIHVEFASPDRLRLIKNDILLSELPRSWAHHTLTLEPLNPPILVVQIELSEREWVYIAGLLPPPYMTLNVNFFDRGQWLFLLLSTAIIMVLTYMLMRRQVRPLRNLARAANDMSMAEEPHPLIEEGADELVTATRAFNRMHQRIRRYIADREQLFSSISHDLKTPITRLRLRTELLNNEDKREKFTRDLDDLELMVKGALQCVRDTELHENSAPIDIESMILNVAETYNMTEKKVEFVPNQRPPIVGKPLAIKRVLTNLVDNGVKYGKSVDIRVHEENEWLIITLYDNGPGIPVDYLEKVFEPYFRLSNAEGGHGLGLGICRSILNGHGGDIALRNAAQGGLEVKVFIPLDIDL